MRESTLRQARSELHARLLQRRQEIEEAVLARVYAVSDSAEPGDPEYAASLRSAVAAAIDYGLAGVESGAERSPSVPAVLLVQARLAARSGVSLDIVLRRYFAGYTLLVDFLIEESEGGDLVRGADLKRLLRSQASLLDRVLSAVSEEHGRDGQHRLATTDQRRAEQVRRLLNGELLDSAELGYDFVGFHLGIGVRGLDASEELSGIVGPLDRRLLVIGGAQGEAAWAWLGGRRAFEQEELDQLLSGWPARTVVAIGEPGEGLAGWRLTHQQARAAFSVALSDARRPARYADVALLASMLRDELLATSLRQMYLAPLEAERDGGAVLRQTMRAYLEADRNISSTAAKLGVNRKTIAHRLGTIERLIGRPLTSCVAEIDAVLRMKELDYSVPQIPPMVYWRSRG